MKNEFFDALFNYHVGGDDKQQINLAWPYRLHRESIHSTHEGFP